MPPLLIVFVITVHAFHGYLPPIRAVQGGTTIVTPRVRPGAPKTMMS